MNPPKLMLCPVAGFDGLVLVDGELAHDCHEILAAHYRARGLTGDALDHAIVDALPQAIACALCCDREGTVH